MKNITQQKYFFEILYYFAKFNICEYKYKLYLVNNDNSNIEIKLKLKNIESNST